MKNLSEKYSRNYDRVENILIIALVFACIVTALDIKGATVLLPTLLGAYAIANHFATILLHKRIDIDKGFSHSVVFWYRIFGIGYTLTLIVLALCSSGLSHRFLTVLSGIGGLAVLLGLVFLYPRKKDLHNMGFSYPRTFIRTIILAVLSLLVLKSLL